MDRPPIGSPEFSVEGETSVGTCVDLVDRGHALSPADFDQGDRNPWNEAPRCLVVDLALNRSPANDRQQQESGERPERS